MGVLLPGDTNSEAETVPAFVLVRNWSFAYGKLSVHARR